MIDTILPRSDQFDTMAYLLSVIASSDGGMDITSWQSIQQIVRLGLGRKLFPVGYEFSTFDADTGRDLIWVVRGHDHHRAANQNLVHTMTLETKFVYSNANGSQKLVQFDGAEALYYAENGLSAGTYCFTVSSQNRYPSDNGKTYRFTLTQPVPVGGQIVLDAAYNATLEGKSVKTYSSASSTTAIETATLTEGAAGSSFGTTDGSGNMNHINRAFIGSNNYAQSAVRQIINSAAAAGSVWSPTTKFDRPPNWVTSYNGFLHGLPEDFLSVVQPAIVPCRTNNIFECAEFDMGQTYEIEDRFFLLSQIEIYGTTENAAIKDGDLLEFYDGLSNEERMKFDVSGASRVCWMRTPSQSRNYTVQCVTAGGVSYNNSNSSYAFAPACIIA